jgi:hypothetical protein
VGKVLEQSYHIVFKQSEAFSTADGHLILLDFLQLVDSVADVHPAACAGVFDDWVAGILLRSDLVDRLAITLQDLASVASANSAREHGCVRADGDVAHWKEVVLGVVVGVDVDFSSCHQNEGRVDVDGELDVAFLVSVELEFGLLLG